MFKGALRERFPEGTDSSDDGFGPPPPVGYDLVVDLRELKNVGERAPHETTASER